MTKFTVRRAELRDADPFADCIDAAYSVYATRVTDLPPVSEGLAETIANHRVWVAEIEHQPIGGVVLVLHDKYAVLENIAVHPRYSGLGVGGALIKQVEADCTEVGIHELRLSTHVAIPENVRLYEHLGWRETGRSRNKVRMSKEL